MKNVNNPKLIYRCNLNKNPHRIFWDRNEQAHSTMYMKRQRAKNNKDISEEGE